MAHVTSSRHELKQKIRGGDRGGKDCSDLLGRVSRFTFSPYGSCLIRCETRVIVDGNY